MSTPAYLERIEMFGLSLTKNSGTSTLGILAGFTYRLIAT